MTPKPRGPHGGDGDGGNGDGPNDNGDETPDGTPGDGDGADKPSQSYGDIDAGKGVTSAHTAIEKAATRGRPGGEGTGEGRPGDGETTQPADPREPPPGVTFDDPRRPNLGSDGRYYIREGVDHDVPIDEPGNVARTITDIDRPEDGVLWEEKSATNASDINRWVTKQVNNKIEAYIEARQHIAGYEDAPVGIDFTSAGADPAFRAAVEQTIADLRLRHPDVTILVRWAE
jgi:hypothetical protein